MNAAFHNLVSGRGTGIAATALRAMLAGASLPYRTAVSARNCLFDAGLFQARRAAVPVVSIGNITLGGTGKTPFVEFVCRWFLTRGRRVAILSRGYGSDGGPNDEARTLATNLPDVPHYQGKDRVALADRAARDVQPDVLVLDDGFQHRRLARDLDIVLIDCTEPFGYGRLLPRGLLREPISSLERADLIVLSRANQAAPAERQRIRERIVAAAGDKPIVLAEHRPTALQSVDGRSLSLDELPGRSVAAFCAIGNPQAFWQTLTALGCQLVGTRAFRDHHLYSLTDLAELGDWTSHCAPEFVITTQKDMVKIPVAAWSGRRLFALQIEAAVTDPDGYLDRFLSHLLVPRESVQQAA